MGNVLNKKEEPKTVRVKAPKAMKAGDTFAVGEYGAKWDNLEVSEGGAKKRQTIDAICKNAKITVMAQESADEGEDYIAGNLIYEYTLKAKTGRVDKGESVTVSYEDILSKEVRMLKKNPITMKIPSENFTGVKEHITVMCASLSDQIYEAGNKDQFKLEVPAAEGSGKKPERARVVVFDNHGDSDVAIPAFAVAVTEKTMIMGWRGTNTRGPICNTALDFITDAAIGPVVCAELGIARSGIRMHNAMSSFASSDLDIHKEKIIEEIQNNEINEIVFTGHSMGGGIAYTAHPILQAQMDGYFVQMDGRDNDASIIKEWKDLKRLNRDIKLKSVVFSAVMSLFGLEESNNKIQNRHSKDLLEKVGENSVNLIFGCDVVPRLFSHYEYVGEVLDAVEISDIIKEKSGNFFVGTIAAAMLPLEKIVESLKEMGKQDLVPAIKNFRHIGKLLYYKDMDATKKDPERLIDTGPINGKATTNKREFNHYTYKSHKLPKGKNDFDALLAAHGYPKDLLASYLSKGSIELESYREDHFNVPGGEGASHNEEPTPKRSKTS